MPDNNWEKAFTRMAETYAEAEGRAILLEGAALQGAPASPRMDARVAHALRRQKARTTWRVMGSLAAAAATVLLVFAGLRLVPMTTRQAATPQLAMVLPVRFTVTRQEEDRGARVYHLADAQHDNAVMTLEYGDAPHTTQDMQESRYKDTAVYSISRREFKLMTFAHEGVVYTLTCRNDMDTLRVLAEKVLDGN